MKHYGKKSGGMKKSKESKPMKTAKKVAMGKKNKRMMDCKF